MKSSVLSILIFFTLFNVSVSAYTIDSTTKLQINQGPVLFVGGTGPGNYSTIQQAIDNASAGNTIYVYKNIYKENLWINKTLHLIGQNPDTTIIDGDGDQHVITITAEHVSIQGFTIQTGDDITYRYGLNIEANHTQINNTCIFNNYFGIYIHDHTNTTITHNTFINNICGLLLYSTGNTVRNNTFFNDGIHTTTSENTIENNTVNNKPLLYLEHHQNHNLTPEYGQIILINCINITIQHQKLDHTYIGIILHNSQHCTISKNNFRYCQSGLTLQNSDHNNISHNDVYRNINYGIGLYNSHNNTIYSNVITQQTQGEFVTAGIHISGSDDNTITHNFLTKNGVGITCAGSHHNHITHNNLVSQLYTGIALYSHAENNILSQNILRQNPRGIWHTDCTHNQILYNDFYDNDKALLIDSIQYHIFQLKQLPTIKGNYWDRPRHLPYPILGDFCYVFSDVPFGGSIDIRWIYMDWRPAQTPNMM